MDKIIVAIGGGEIKNKTTIKIDGYVAELAKAHAGDKRANALFIGTASHDSMPYFNSFRKTYTSVYDIKAEVALIVYGEMNLEHIAQKIRNADCIYIGGGDTVFMLEKWKQTGLDKLIIEAYNNGTIIAGLSAGAICWFTDMYTDYEIMRGQSSEYVLRKGLGILEGTMCPHFDEREADFFKAVKDKHIKNAIAVENDCAIVFKNGVLSKVVSENKNAYYINYDGVNVKKERITL